MKYPTDMKYAIAYCGKYLYQPQLFAIGKKLHCAESATSLT